MRRHMAELPDKPILFFKVARIGALPKKFGQVLGDEFGVEIFSVPQMRAEIEKERQESQDDREVTQRHINSYMRRQAASALRAGNDAFPEVALNVPNSRERMAVKTAQRSGAFSVALNIETPFNVAKDRVERWTREDSFDKPLSDWRIPPIVILELGLNDITIPEAGEEGVDFIFNLDGSEPAEGIMDQIDRHLVNHGLIDA
jgi:hypothetical protein